jgi:DNA-binding NtrC family response regulator
MELKKPKILLVEDDVAFRKVVASNLSRHHFTVGEAENGSVAKQMFDDNPKGYYLIISDIRMPVLDGVGLLQHVRKTSAVPFIIMTGFSEILEAQDAYKLGATGFLPKPLSTTELLGEIEKCLNRKTKSAEASQSTKYAEVAMDKLLTFSNLPSDVYLCLGEHFLKIANKGDVISEKRLQIYRSNNVLNLFVLAAEICHYRNEKAAG